MLKMRLYEMVRRGLGQSLDVFLGEVWVQDEPHVLLLKERAERHRGAKRGAKYQWFIVAWLLVLWCGA